MHNSRYFVTAKNKILFLFGITAISFMFSGNVLAQVFPQNKNFIRVKVIDVLSHTGYRTEVRYGEVCSGWPADRYGDDERYYDSHSQYNYGAKSGHPVAGAIIGAIIGSQIGDGNGQVAATAIGAVTGAAIGSGSHNRHNRHNRPYNRNYGHDNYRYNRRYDRQYRYGNKYRGYNQRRNGDCRVENYPVRVKHNYYEIVYIYNGQYGSINSDTYPRDRYVLINVD